MSSYHRSYTDIDWNHLTQRYSAWWRGELETPLFHVITQPFVQLQPRPYDHAAVKHWFMHPETRIQREVDLNRGRWYYLDGFPSVEIARINIEQAAFYGCPANFTYETVWLEPILDQWEGWQDKIRFDPTNELWQMTLEQAHLARQAADGEMAISILGGFDGVLDNLAAVRGNDHALKDVLENTEQVIALEQQFLKDFQTYYFSLYDIIKDNPRGITTWNRALMTEGPVHCMQSDFSCMISPRMYRQLGLWYLEKQAAMFSNVMYHLDGSNALQHLPMLLEIPKLDCIQFTYQIPHAKKILDLLEVWNRILKAGKRVEIWVQDNQEIIPLLDQVPWKGLKLNIFTRNCEEADELVKKIEKKVGAL